MQKSQQHSKIEQGFSSQDQNYQQQQKPHLDLLHQKKSTISKIEISFIVPPRPQIKNKKYSLRPDIIMGWKPKIQPSTPIPIIFESNKYDAIIKKLIKTATTKHKLCYLGPRYENTYYAWHNKPFKFPYSHMNAPLKIKYSDRQYFGQLPDCREGLIFESHFESGNLDCAIKVGQTQYDLFMRVDSNTKGHLQWFNFKVTNLIPNIQYKFNICNFKKKKILYFRGAKPYIFSSQRMNHEKIGWQQRGENVTFRRGLSKAFQNLGIQGKTHYKLSFETSTKYKDDELQFAYCIPYTYSHLNQYLNEKLNQCHRLHLPILKIGKLCTSLGGLEVPLITICENVHALNLQQDTAVLTRKCVLICGRAHPGQSNGSFMMQGLLNFLLSDSKAAYYLRSHVIFKIVPMVNVDGVAIGNYRTGLSGRDFNRQYKDPDPALFPQVFSFKKLVQDNKKIFDDNLSLFLDFHGHSVKKNTFAYGPQFSIVNKFYYESRIFPKLLSNLTPMFRYHSCTFKISQCKKSTARAIILKKLHVPFSFTIQTSNSFYHDFQKLEDVAFTSSRWKIIGEKIGYALEQYFELVIKADQIRQSKHRSDNNKKIIKKDVIIRKTKRSLSGPKHNNKKQQTNPIIKPQISMIFQNLEENYNAKTLFEQIQKAEQQKQNILTNNDLKCSDDELSEGNSDSEGEQDDLSLKKMTELFNAIKTKTLKNFDNSKLISSVIINLQDDDENNININSRINSNLKETSIIRKQNKNRINQEIMIKRGQNKSEQRKLINLNNNIIISVDKRRSITPRPMRFNFGSHTPQINTNNNQLHKKNQTSKINFFDMSKQHQDDDNELNSKNKFSDYFFRQTYRMKIKQLTKQIDNNKEGILPEFQTYLPHHKKSDRLSNYRMKRVQAQNPFMLG